MSKGLEKLKLIQKVFEKLAEWSCCDLSKLNEGFETNFDFDFAIIEKELKALEIIKEKRLAWVWFIDNKLSLEDYNKSLDYLVCEPTHKPKKLTQEEYNLLKEVLLCH